MKKNKNVDEYGYIPRYQNMSFNADSEMFNELMHKMNVLYCKWYGSAYGVSSAHVDSLKEKIKRGETTFAKWKKEFEDDAYKRITGHTLTEERQQKKEQKAKEEKLCESIYNKISKNCSFTPDEFTIVKKLFKK